MDSGRLVGVYGGGFQFIAEGPDFPRACVVNSVHYSTVYPKRGQELLQKGYHPL